MVMILLWAVLLLGVLAASYTDLRTREVPDWLNFALVASGIGVRILWSISTGDYSVAIAGIMGFAISFALALLLFYTGQWGGGDSKLLMGVGSLLGVTLTPDDLFLAFLVNLIMVGAVYGLWMSYRLAWQNRRRFIAALTRYSTKYRRVRYGFHALMLSLALGGIFVSPRTIQLLLYLVILVSYLSWYSLWFSKAVEQGCMVQTVSPLTVTEGDWIAKDVVVNGTRITGPKDLGISRAQLRLIQRLCKAGKLSKVTIKVGIPFAPSFFGAAVCTLLWGNVLMRFI